MIKNVINDLHLNGSAMQDTSIKQDNDELYLESNLFHYTKSNNKKYNNEDPDVQHP